MSYVLGVDVGGTFTDCVLLDRHTGAVVVHKQPSTPADPAAAVIAGLSTVMARGDVAPVAIGLVAHGTTIALNALLQRRGARLAVVVSRGNQDLLELARIKILEGFDFFARPEPPLVPRDCVVEIDARLDREGRPSQKPEGDELDRVAGLLMRLQCDAVAVVLLNAYANPAFEADIAEALARRLHRPVTASASVWAANREYERAMVAVMNAYVTPMMRTYYAELKARLSALDVTAPLALTTSNGGCVDAATAAERPIDSLFSGPASGVMAAIATGRRAGIDRLVTFDMGGTSADIAIATGLEPELTAQTTIGELPLIVPVVNVTSIGAGGGSIVRVDVGGLLKVGPGSAGADPGPACFDRGGTVATVTDCYLVCGLLDPATFAGGQIPLSVARARAAVESVADRLGYVGDDRVERAAWAALRVASSRMATEVRKALAKRGDDPATFTLVPFGGAGPTHAAFLADHASLSRILVASRPGLFCAIGAATADLRRDFVHGARLRFGGDDAADRAAFRAALATLCRDADTWVASLGGLATRWGRRVAADVRYEDQAFDLTIGLDVDDVADLVDRLVCGFHDEHERRYGFQLPASRTEMRRLVLSAVAPTDPVPVPDETASITAAVRRRTLFIDGEFHEADVLARGALRAALEGPVILEQPDTTIVVPRGWTIRPLQHGSALMTRAATASARGAS